MLPELTHSFPTRRSSDLSVPRVGGLVLSLMTLPIIIVAGRAALKAVPPSIREAALAVGASKLQVVLHHVLPLAMPGILTGTIIGMAHRSEENTSELQSLMRNSYAVFCLKKKTTPYLTLAILFTNT